MRWLTLLVASWLLISSSAFGMENHTDVLRDNKGLAIKDATVSVYLAGTLTFATLFEDNGTTLKSNPFPTSNSQTAPGAYSFYAVNGVYDIVFSKDGYSFVNSLTRRIALFDVNDGGGGGGGGTPGFDDILTGDNTTATMRVGTGATLSTTGSGTISANRYNGNAVIAIADGGTNLAAAADDAVMVGNGTTWQSKVIPDCDNGTTQKLLYDQATNVWSCGTDQNSGAPAFSAVTTGVNTGATMTVDTGATLTFSGSGTVNASTYKGNATVAAADGGTGQTAVTDDGVLVANGTTFQLKVVPDCSNASTSKVLYTASTNTWSCGSDQGAGAGTTFDAIGNGTNTTATAMIVGTGASLTTSGTGTLAATHSRPKKVTVTNGTSPYTATNADYHIFCDTSGGAVSITLPAATVTSRLYVYKTASANACTVNRAGSDTINTGIGSGTSLVINNAGSNFWLQPDGTSVWYVGG